MAILDQIEAVTADEVREAVAWLQTQPKHDAEGPKGLTPAAWAMLFGVAASTILYGDDPPPAPMFDVLRELDEKHGCLADAETFADYLRLYHTCGRPSDVPTEDGYPEDWPRCPGCGRPALDGHITCGDARCAEGAHRRGGAVTSSIPWPQSTALEFTIEVRKESSSAYVATIDALDGAIGHGKAPDEAVRQVKALALRILAGQVAIGERVLTAVRFEIAASREDS